MSQTVIDPKHGAFPQAGDKASGAAAVYTAPYSGATALSVDMEVKAGLRGLAVVATVAGNVSMKLADGSALIVPVPIGLTILPFSVVMVVSATTTAVATYANLK